MRVRRVGAHPGGESTTDAGAAAALPRWAIPTIVLDGWVAEAATAAGGVFDRSRLESPRRWPGPRVELTPSDQVDPAAVRMLLAGRTVRLSQLVVPASFPLLALRLRAAERAARVALERHGLDVLRIVLGTVTWDAPDGSEPAPTGRGSGLTVDPAERAPTERPVLPALVADVEVSLRAGEDADLTVRGRWELAPAVLDRLGRAGVQLDPDTVLGPDGGGRLALERLQRAGTQLPGFRVNQRVMVGVLPFLGRSAVDDLEMLPDLLVGEGATLVAALGGDATARSEVSGVGAGSAPDLGSSERSVLAADAAQRAIVETTLQGGHAVGLTAPGTGTARTVVNVIASHAAAGRSVLVVADESATRRRIGDLLGAAGLTDLVLDPMGAGSPETTVARRTLTERLLAGPGRWAAVPAPGPDPDEARRAELEELLVRHDRGLHELRHPWEVSVHDAIGELLALDRRSEAPTPDPSDPTVDETAFDGGDAGQAESVDRLPGRSPDPPVEMGVSRVALPRRVVAALPRGELDTVAEELATWVAQGGESVARGEGVWSGSIGLITDDAQVAEILGSVDRARSVDLPVAERELRAVFDSFGQPVPPSLRVAEEQLALLGELAAVLERYRPEVVDPALGLDDLAGLDTTAAPTGRWRGRRAGRRVRRAARAALAAHRLDGVEVDEAEALDDLGAIQRIRAAWRVGGLGERPPSRVPPLDAVRVALDTLNEGLTRLAGFAPAIGPLRSTGSLAELAAHLEALSSARAELARLPGVDRLRHDLEARELTPVLDAVAEGDLDPEQAGLLLRRSWLRAVLDELALIDEAVGAGDGAALDQAADELGRLNARRRARVPVQVRASVATRAQAACAGHPELLDQPETEPEVRPVRELLGRSPTPLVAARPVWCVSPHLVAELLPAPTVLGGSSGEPDSMTSGPTLFDLVVIVGAERLSVAEVVPALLRARQCVVLGDPRRVAPGADASVLTEVAELLPADRQVELRWFHRLGDGRLARLAERIADRDPLALLAVPLPTPAPPVRLVDLASGEGDRAPSEERIVASLVDLVVEHAVHHPTWSLAVVTPTEALAERLSVAIVEARPTDRVLDRLLSEPSDEAVIVRSIAGWAGQLRDHLIVVPTTGPMDEPRTAVADRALVGVVGSARNRITVVAAAPIEAARPAGVGDRLVRAAAETDPVGGAATIERPDPVLADLGARLRRRGVPVEQRPGRVPELTLQHPSDPQRTVLAVLGDRPVHPALASVVDRECLLPEQLSRLGWRWHRVRSIEWWRDPESELDRLLLLWRQLR